MPVRINNGAGAHYKQYDLHTGSLGAVVGLQLTEKDAKKLENNSFPQVTLDDLPDKIFIKVQGQMTKCSPGLPEGEFPIMPKTTDWNLYSSTELK